MKWFAAILIVLSAIIPAALSQYGSGQGSFGTIGFGGSGSFSGTFSGNGAGLTNLNLGSLSGTTPALINSFTNSLWITNNGIAYRVPVY